VVTVDDLRQGLAGADRRLLPRLATLIENEDPRGLDVLDRLYPSSGAAHVIGITGPPGAGKSTLVSALIAAIRTDGRNVAVIAVDPSSTVTGGAVLGDRIRMMESHADAGVFVRSMASRGRQGGLAWTTASLVHLLDAAGYPVILVETVGTGQDGTDIASLAETVVVVEAPGLGDGVQAIKSGLLEVGDIVVVNKADQPGADDALRTLRASFEMGRHPDDRRVPIIPVVSTNGVGVDRLVQEIDTHAGWLRESGQLTIRRERGSRAEVLSGLRSVLDLQLNSRADATAALANLLSRVTDRELSPRQAVDELAASLATIGPH
jgi:LAO/AO transport system kinase